MSETDEQHSHDLIMLAENGNVNGLIEYIEMNNIKNLNNIKGMSGFTLLHHACNRGHMLMVFELIKAKVDVLAINDGGETALHLAAYSGNLLVVEQLLDSGNCIIYIIYIIFIIIMLFILY
jgi:ankyrin repeat protein